VANYTSTFAMHIGPHLGDRVLADLVDEEEILDDWLATLKRTPTRRPREVNADGRTLSSSTIRGAATVLRRIAAHSRARLHIPLKDLRLRKRQRPRALQTLADVRALLDACKDPWFRVACAIACYAGCRLGEVASLRWRYVRPNGTVLIELNWEGPLKHRYEDERPEDTVRVAPLAPDLAAILESWREVTGGGPDDRIVLVGGKRPLRERVDSVSRRTRAACRRAGLQELTFHSLRATYATIAVDQGLPISKLQALMGHADAATTSIYIRPEAQHAATDPRAILGGTALHGGTAVAPAPTADLASLN
jgi:integrase